MTTHELARLLLDLPDAPAYTRNQTYDETTYNEVSGACPTELVDTRHGEVYDADHFSPRLAMGATYLKGMVIL